MEVIKLILYVSQLIFCHVQELTIFDWAKFGQYVNVKKWYYYLPKSFLHNALTSNSKRAEVTA